MHIADDDPKTAHTQVLHPTRNRNRHRALRLLRQWSIKGPLKRLRDEAEEGRGGEACAGGSVCGGEAEDPGRGDQPAGEGVKDSAAGEESGGGCVVLRGGDLIALLG